MIIYECMPATSPCGVITRYTIRPIEISRQTSNIRRTLAGDTIVDPIASPFST